MEPHHEQVASIAPHLTREQRDYMALVPPSDAEGLARAAYASVPMFLACNETEDVKIASEVNPGIDAVIHGRTWEPYDWDCLAPWERELLTDFAEAVRATLTQVQVPEIPEGWWVDSWQVTCWNEDDTAYITGDGATPDEAVAALAAAEGGEG